MRSYFGTLAILTLALGGCAQQHVHHLLQAREPGYLVPTAAIIQRPGSTTPGTADQVLPESDGDVYIARAEKTAWGNLPVYEYSSFSIFTYDAQRLSSPREGGGYRYRWGVQSGVSLP